MRPPIPRPMHSLDAWREVSGVLAAALESVSEEALAQPATKGPPSTDGKVSGIVNFLAIHETYHSGRRLICAAGWGTKV